MRIALLLLICFGALLVDSQVELPNDLKEWGYKGPVKEVRSLVYRHPDELELTDTTDHLSSINHAYFNEDGNIYLTESSYGLNSDYSVSSTLHTSFEGGLKSSYVEKDSYGDITSKGTYTWSGYRGYVLQINHDEGGQGSMFVLLDENFRDQAGSYTYTYEGEIYYKEQYVNHFDSSGKLIYVDLQYPEESRKQRQEYRNVQRDKFDNPVYYEMYRAGKLYQVVHRSIRYYED